MTLRLTSNGFGYRQCPDCKGQGKVPQPPTLSVRSIGTQGTPLMQPGTGHPIPCPKCKGRKYL